MSKSTRSKDALEDFRNELKDELQEIKDALNELKKLKDDIKEIKSIREELREVLRENRELKSKNEGLVRKVEELEQYQRSNNVEVKGVPLDSEPVDVIKKLGQIVKENIEEDDIDICHRVPTARHDEFNIVVRFVRRNKKNAFLAKAKKVKLETKMLGFEVSSPVFVNEHLTRHGKQLLGAAIKKKKEAGWRYVWTAAGKIYARRNEGSPALRIFSVDDLEKMTSIQDTRK